MSSFSKICLVLAVDGYMVNGIFQTREMAFNVPKSRFPPKSVHFYVETPTAREEERQGQYVFSNIHGLPVQGGNLAQYMVPLCLLDLYSTHKSKKKPLVAIKGSKHAQALLEGLKIPFIDLEKFGCPRFELLRVEADYTCGQHKFHKRCSKAMVAAYTQWMHALEV